jgi:tryptophan-rich sensory protein
MSSKQFRGYTAGAVAFVTCPCHLPIVWPILLALTAGTAFGAWLAANMLLVGIMMTVTFLVGLVLAIKWLVVKSPTACTPNKLKSQKVKLQNEQI